jgi:class 3 adenylate cyclase/DNA-binding CsgD family transcriptional regulator
VASAGDRQSGVVVLLFTDVVGSTELLGRLGDDRAEQVRRAHFALLREAVSTTRGHEVKTLGDGMMVAFDSPLEALRCAVAMQTAVAGHNRGEGTALDIRVGLHAGEPATEDGDFHGTAVVVAKRLCDQAAGGQILSSQLVADLVGTRGGFRFRPLGRVTLKGLARPVAAVAVEWQLDEVAPKPAPSTARPRPKPPRARGPGFVGRDKELGVLRAEFAQAQAAELRCVLLVGEAGVGKTRLAAELLAHVHAHAVTLSARAYSLGATASFGLWAEALEGHLRGLEPEEVVALCGGFLDDLAGLLHSVAAARGSVPDIEPPRLRLLEALAVVLSNLARQESVVVVLDDVHHADSSSWEALHYLALNLQAMPVLVVASARPAELADHPVAPQVLFGLEQEGLLQRLVVGRLDAGAVGELAAAVVGRSPPAALVEWLETRSRGNALFALGLLQALIDEGADLAAPVLRRIPEALADRVGSRLKLLDEPALATIELLAVLGRRVGIAELVEMSSRPRDRLDEILLGLLRAGLVVEEERGRELTYEIAHPLIQEAVYQRIGGGRRRALHRLAGRALLAAGRPGDAAPHFSRSADHGDAEATGALCEALRQAEQREADREALEILGALVELVPSHDQAWTDVARAMTWHADWVVDHRFDNADLGVRAMREISAVLGRSGDVAGRASANLRLASFLAWGTPELGEAERVCGQALELFEQAGDVHRMLLARNELGWIKGIGSEAAAMEAEGEQVVDAARELGDRFALMQGLTTTGNAAMFLGHFEAAEAALGTSLVIAAEDGKLYEQTRVLSVLAMSRAYEGRMEAALDAIRQAKSVNPAVPPTWEPLAHWMRGNVRDALAAIQAGMAWKPIGTSRRRSVLLAFAALSLAEADEVDEAKRYRVAASAVYDGPFMYFSSYSAYAGAVLGWREGRRRESLVALQAVASGMLERGFVPFASPVLVDLAEMAVESRELEMAEQAAADLATVARRVDRDLHHALAALAGATASFGRGALDEAANQSRTALSLLAGIDYPGFEGRGLFMLGQSLCGSDRAGAIEALERAAATFDACGATWRRDRALDALRALRGRGQRAAGAVLGPGSLTRREREVASLASQGLSAREIADRLYIGERTVEGHLASIYAKLGIHSKTDLVRRASEFPV